MGLPSYLADIQDRAIDNQIAASAFGYGGAGAAVVALSFRAAQKRASELVKERRLEAEARKIEERTGRLVDDKLAWIEVTVGVVPLRQRR